VTSPAALQPVEPVAADERPRAPRRIAHVITGLEVGGAESMLHKLLAASDRHAFDPLVISLGSDGPIGARTAALGVRVRALGMSRRFPSPAATLRLAWWLRRERIELVQTWMYHADLVGGLAARLAGIPVVWGIRQSDLDPLMYSARTVWVQKVCARLSRVIPERIVSCSEAGRRMHEAIGYDASRMVHIPNGFELERFAPSEEHRRAVRAELGLAPDTPLVGLVARFDPAKDHETFLRAAAIVVASLPQVHVVLAGLGVDDGNRELTGLCRDLNISASVHLLGRRADVERVTAALDVACSSSRTEGFANTVGEGMACGVPCVVTDCGDSATIVGDAGVVVPPRDRTALATGIISVLRRPTGERAALGAAARSRVQCLFDIRAVARRYGELHASVLDRDA